jgi:hypothetical protein
LEHGTVKGWALTRFDGVALLDLGASTEVARRHDAAEVRRRADGRLARLPDGALARITLPIGLPATLRCDDGAVCTEVAVLGLAEVAAGRSQGGSGSRSSSARDGGSGRAKGSGNRSGSAKASGSGGPDDRGTPLDLGRLLTPAQPEAAGPMQPGARVAVLPPVPVRDLVAVEPLPGGRVHAARWGDDTLACGRLPVSGPTHPPATIDCPRCLAGGVLGERIVAQLTAADDLVQLAGPLTAGAAARWWWRTDHLDARLHPAVLDSAVGALVHALPGAPDPDALLARLAEHGDHLSAAARAWAVAAARQRVTTDSDAVRLLARLLPPADAGELLLDVLGDRPGDRELEALLWEVAVRAGPAGSPRLQRWRRIQAVAAALAS